MGRQDNTEVIQLPENITEMSFDELCTVCQASPDFIIELISYGTIEPIGNSKTSWRFDVYQLNTIRTAIRLHHDLEVNHAGVALAIDLLNQMDDLQNELNTFKKYFEK